MVNNTTTDFPSFDDTPSSAATVNNGTRAHWHSPFGRRSFRRSDSSRAPAAGASWHVYVLQLADDRFFVGSSQDVRERFAQHLSGKGGRVTTRWPPVGFGPIAMSPPIEQPTNGTPDDFQKDVLALERLVTAQLVILLGVNRVRGGAVKDVMTDDGSVVTDYDLVHPRDYDRNNADLDLVASKVATPLCLDFIMTRKHVDAMLRDSSSGQRFFGTPKITIDRGWNVIVNGHVLKHKSLNTTPYEQNLTSMHPRISSHDWIVLFRDSNEVEVNGFDEMELGYSSADYPNTMDGTYDPGHDAGDVFAIGFGVLLVSTVTLAITTFNPRVTNFLASAGPAFAFVCLALLLPCGIILQMRQQKGPFNLLFVIIFTITTSLLASYAAIKAATIRALVLMDFALFMWTIGVMAAAGVMAVISFLWGKITGGRNGLVISSIFGVIADISVLVAMYSLWNDTTAGVAQKAGFGIGYLVVTVGCLVVLLRDAWTVDVRERYWTKRAMLFVPAAVIPALLCYGMGYVLFAVFSALKFV